MREADDANGKPLPDELRLTKLGRFLRATSLDELPELWNIVRGDMSFVGPRPLLAEYLAHYTAEQARRHEVLPGLTGWAQIHGRNELSWEEKFKLDVWYADNCSFLLDFKILVLTVREVFTRRGVSKSGYATTEKFAGPEVVGESNLVPHKGVIVLGAGDHAKVVISTLQAAGLEVAAAYDDALELQAQVCWAFPCSGVSTDCPASRGPERSSPLVILRVVKRLPSGLLLIGSLSCIPGHGSIHQ